MHGQVVLCPGLNDGVHLERTIDDLLRFYPSVASLAIVPVGLTDHRNNFPVCILLLRLMRGTDLST